MEERETERNGRDGGEGETRETISSGRKDGHISIKTAVVVISSGLIQGDRPKSVTAKNHPI